MKNRMRLRVAVDLCIQDKLKTILYMFETIAFLSLITFTLYLIVSDTGFKDRIQKGLSVPVTGIGYVSVTADDVPSVQAEISHVDGVMHMGGIQCGVSNTSEELAFLREIQGNHRISYSEEDNGETLETTVMSGDLWDVMNLRLIEGKLPSEYEIIESEKDILIYVSEKYRDYVRIGDIYSDKIGDKEIFRYIIAGIISDDSSVIDPYVFSDTLLDRQGFYSMEYGVIEVMDTSSWNGCFFTYNEDIGYKKISSDIIIKAEKAGAKADVYNISDVADYIVADMERDTYYLKEIALIMAVMMVISLTAGRIYSIIIRSSDYGIWVSCGATAGDLSMIVIWQNVITMIIPLVVSSVLMYNVLRIFYTDNMVSLALLNEIYLSRCIPTQFALVILTVGLSCICPAGIFRHIKAAQLVRGRIWR